MLRRMARCLAVTVVLRFSLPIGRAQDIGAISGQVIHPAGAAAAALVETVNQNLGIPVAVGQSTCA